MYPSRFLWKNKILNELIAETKWPWESTQRSIALWLFSTANFNAWNWMTTWVWRGFHVEWKRRRLCGGGFHYVSVIAWKCGHEFSLLEFPAVPICSWPSSHLVLLNEITSFRDFSTLRGFGSGIVFHLSSLPSCWWEQCNQICTWVRSWSFPHSSWKFKVYSLMFLLLLVLPLEFGLCFLYPFLY